MLLQCEVLGQISLSFPQFQIAIWGRNQYPRDPFKTLKRKSFQPVKTLLFIILLCHERYRNTFDFILRFLCHWASLKYITQINAQPFSITAYLSVFKF